MNHVATIFCRLGILALIAAADCSAATIRVQSADGGPLAGVTAICVDQRGGSQEIHRTDARGEFAVDLASGYWCFLVADDTAGFGLATPQGLAHEPVLVVRPWARLEGICTNHGRPRAQQELAIALDAKSYGPNLTGILFNVPQLGSLARTRTDAQGRYVFPRVPSGALQICELTSHPPGVFNPVQTVELAPGERRTMEIATQGRPVTGRFEPADKSAAGFDFASSSSYLLQDAPEREHPLEIHPDGSFLAEGVEPGTYRLTDLTEQYGAKRIALVEVGTVEIPPVAPTETGDAPFDVGKILVRKVPELKVGDLAPDFSVTTLDGRPLSLADFRGKFVLLDFWATWCGPCVGELPTVESVYHDFQSDPRFTLVLLSLDAERGKPTRFVEQRKLAGVQGFLGEWINDSVTRRYGVFSIPALFLIGPDGRIVARDLEGDRIRTAVASALASP